MSNLIVLPQDLRIGQPKRTVWLVEVIGSVDSSTASQLGAVFTKWLSEEIKHDARIDLAQCDYLSAAGMRALLDFFKQLKRHEISLWNLSEKTRRALDGTGFTDLFKIREGNPKTDA